MKKYLSILLMLLLLLSLMSCGDAEANESNNQMVSKTEIEVASEANTDTAQETKVTRSSNLVKCDEIYKAKDLSFHVIGLEIDQNVLRVKMEVYNHSNENIDFSPIDSLTVFDENNQECSWNMMVGKLNGLITPGNKITGVVGFDLDNENAESFVLHIGQMYEYEPAIEIESSDIGMTFAEVFENSGIASDYGIGVPVKSDQFDMTVVGAKIMPCDKEGKDIVLIDLSIKNNDSEPLTLGFQLDGVFTAQGEALSSAVNEWTFINGNIESGTTETGIISYYCQSGQADFYMVVRPNLDEFDKKEVIAFTAEAGGGNASNITNEGLGLLESLTIERPESMKIVSEMTAFNTNTVMTTFYDGDKSRTEIDVPGMNKSILLYLPDEEVMYQYVYGEEMGVKITGADPVAAADMGMMMDTQALAEITNASSEDLIAYVDHLDGEEVVYIEATQSDEDMGEVLVKMWYSAKYATPLKYQVYVGETVMMSLVVTDVWDNVNFTADIFSPPEDVTFQEVDMATLSENW